MTLQELRELGYLFIIRGRKYEVRYRDPAAERPSIDPNTLGSVHYYTQVKDASILFGSTVYAAAMKDSYIWKPQNFLTQVHPDGELVVKGTLEMEYSRRSQIPVPVTTRNIEEFCRQAACKHFALKKLES